MLGVQEQTSCHPASYLKLSLACLWFEAHLYNFVLFHQSTGANYCTLWNCLSVGSISLRIIER